MAQKVTTHLVDDLTGDTVEDGKGRTVTFGVDGTNYEIDLADDNAVQLRETFSEQSPRPQDRLPQQPRLLRRRPKARQLRGARQDPRVCRS